MADMTREEILALAADKEATANAIEDSAAEYLDALERAIDTSPHATANKIAELRLEARALRLLAEGERGEPVAWVPEDELPQSFPSAAYDALFPFSRVNIIREFPIFVPPASAPASPVRSYADGVEDEIDRESVAKAIAERAFGRTFDDFNENDAFDIDQNDLLAYADAAIEAIRALAPKEG